MNKAEFITLIDNPRNLDKSHISALKNIAVDFPYFQANHMLLTKALFNENHYEYEQQLGRTALLVSNREILFRFLNELSLSQVSTETAPIIKDEEKSTEAVIEQIIETISPGIEIAEKDEIAISEIVEEAPDAVVTATEEIIETVNKNKEPEILHHRNEVHSFSEWLKLGSLELPGKEKRREISSEAEAEANVEVPEPEKEEVTAKSNINQFESILDKFIRENPSISRPKAEFYNPANFAKQSAEEDDDLVTETLANIYYKQGAYKKAIRAYEKLCLIYPHKMTLFAALIQKIKEESKND